MRNRRDRRTKNKLVVHATNRLIKGLPFVPNEFMKPLMCGIMARAQELYPVCISHFLWMGNHYHIILTGRGAQISPFLGYMQAEIAKALKQLHPRYYETKVWRTRFKEQHLCIPEAVFKAIAYLYNNPTRANLVENIDEYPGLSSWKMMMSGGYAIEAGWVPSRLLSGFHKKIRTRTPVQLARHLKQLATSTHSLRIHPFAWKRCFEETRSHTDEELLCEIVRRVRCREQSSAELRTGPVIGARRLKRRSIFRDYRPKKKKFDRTPYLICPDKELRKVFIQGYRNFCDMCRSAWNALMRGVKGVEFPRGAYLPGAPPGRVCF
jgi:hypothetical protein